MRAAPSDSRSTVALAGAVQFVVMLDFALILPLGPDLTEPLHVSAASLGLPVAAYTIAAAIGGLLVARVLDRFERRAAMLPAVLGLVLAGVAAALAPSFTVLVGARALAGLCAAPSTALVLSLIADEVPSEARGRALGVVMSANAVAGVLGVPACLWLAEQVAWRMAFAAVGAVAVLLAIWIGLAARGARRSRERAPIDPSSSSPAPRAQHRWAHALTFLAFAATFALTPNLSAYVQFNLGYPRSDIPLLYMVAGGCAFVAMRLAGRAVDRRGAAWVGSLAVAGVATTIALLLVATTPPLAVEPAFVALLVCLGGRNVALRTLTTQVPAAAERGRFMALQSTAQQLGAVAGVLLGLLLLRDRPDGSLAGMRELALCSIVLLALLPPLFWRIERAYKAIPATYM